MALSHSFIAAPGLSSSAHLHTRLLDNQGSALVSEFRGIRLSPSSFFPKQKKASLFCSTSHTNCITTISASSGRQPWDFGRFLNTVTFFNEPSFSKIVEALSAFLMGSSEKDQYAERGSKNMGIVLVAGATGGVGKRVVDVLRRKGYSVRVLVRNAVKAKELLGSDIDMVIGDVTKKDTLLPSYFKGVSSVVNTVSVIIGPKEGDTPDRQKYSQGIKFFEPEVKGDSPEKIEFEGLQNLLEAVKDKIGFRDGKMLFRVSDKGLPLGPAWGALDDVVMGGVSESSLQIDLKGGEDGSPVGVFKGFVSTDNNGGFASVRTKNFELPENLSAYEGLELRIKGDGHRYKMIIRTSKDWDALGYAFSFDTVKDQWQSVKLPFSEFSPTFRARTVSNAEAINTSNILSLQLMYSKFEYDGKLNPTFEAGRFELPISSIKAYLKEPITPRFIHVSSAGVTRPYRQGLDLSKQPPAVRMNKELGFVLDFKLKGEDVLRNSGVPYTVVRPCALTEEPGGAELIFDQGDNITGKVSREDVAEICVAALELPSACDKTFEVKSNLAFSEVFNVDPEKPPPPRDFDKEFQYLQKGITGKEALMKEALPL
ncbi:hypothetical protein KP509_38G046400 [Ceratopteris richardii]|uniref:Uncharacterized protein n=2 Tax=Ceratopteris richardii TaxID=49495 RepID=A0A8T2Q4G4_CERRI|nr:hypothetical protein KP509_38G046400 [Ceratopteris richardii]